MSQDYLVFGWRVRSDLPLPCLRPPEADAPDCTIRVLPPLSEPRYTTTQSAQLLEAAGLESVWRVGDDHWRVEYFYTPEDQWVQVDFTREGRDIRILHTANATLRNLPALLLSGQLAPFLRQAGRVCLHGGTVNTSRGGMLILGDSGAGKSSALGALWRQGCAVLSDDIAVLEPAQPCVVHLGPRYLRLLPDSARALGLDPSALPLVFEPPQAEPQKRFLDLREQDCPGSLEVTRIFILAGRRDLETPEVVRLSAKAALEQLLRYRFRGLRLPEPPAPQSLAVCVALAQRCAVYQMHTPNGLESLTQVAEAMLEQPTM